MRWPTRVEANAALQKSSQAYKLENTGRQQALLTNGYLQENQAYLSVPKSPFAHIATLEMPQNLKAMEVNSQTNLSTAKQYDRQCDSRAVQRLAGRH